MHRLETGLLPTGLDGPRQVSVWITGLEFLLNVSGSGWYRPSTGPEPVWPGRIPGQPLAGCVTALRFRLLSSKTEITALLLQGLSELTRVRCLEESVGPAGIWCPSALRISLSLVI